MTDAKPLLTKIEHQFFLVISLTQFSCKKNKLCWFPFFSNFLFLQSFWILRRKKNLDKFDKPFKCPFSSIHHSIFVSQYIKIFVLTPSFYYIYFYDPQYTQQRHSCTLFYFIRNLVNSKPCQEKKNCNNKNNKARQETHT